MPYRLFLYFFLILPLTCNAEVIRLNAESNSQEKVQEALILANAAYESISTGRSVKV